MERSKHMKLMDYDEVKKYLEKIVSSNIKKEGNGKEWGFLLALNRYGNWDFLSGAASTSVVSR